MTEGYTYKFDTSDSTNATHHFKFSTTADGTHGSGVDYTTGVTYNGTSGSAGAYTQIVVAASAPTLYYWCHHHASMGGTANTPAEAATTSMRYKIETLNQSYTAANPGDYVTGNRSSDITVTHDIPMYSGTPASWVNGNTSSSTALTNATAVAGKYIRFAFASARTYTGHRFYNQNNGAENLATWKWQGSNTAGGASGYVDISDSFVLANNTTPEIVSFSLSSVVNSTAYLYYQLLGVSGNADQENAYEMEFRQPAVAESGKVTKIHGTSLAWK